MTKEKVLKLQKAGWKVGTASEFLGLTNDNVYAALNMADSETMLIKAQLVTKIAEIIKRRS